ncbi:MAG: ABC transporter permease [Asgard group archaeon]|nr:ABC transporter permease [Asgard group archaeon]
MALEENDLEINKSEKKEKGKFKSLIIAIGFSLRRIFNQIGAINIRYFRSPTSIFWSIIYPIILLLLFGAIFGRSVDMNYNLEVLDLDDSSQSDNFITNLSNHTSLTITKIEEVISDPESWLRDNNKIILLIIPNDWGIYQNTSNPYNLTVIYDPSSTTAKAIIQIIEEEITNLNFRLQEIEAVFGIEIENYYVNDLNFIDSLVPGIVMITVSTIALFTGLNYDLEEKRSGILQKLATTPAFKFEWIFAKQLWLIIITLIASTITILFSLIFNFNILSLQPMTYLFIILGSLTFSGIAMILVRLINNAEGVVFAALIITIPQILLSGALIPLDTFPQFLQYFARVFPIYYLIEGIRNLMLGAPQQQFWLNFGISFVVAISTFTIGILLTNLRKN